MDDFDLLDDHLTTAEVTLLVAATDEDDGGPTDDRVPARAGLRAPAASRRPWTPIDQGSAHPAQRGAAGCGCALAAAGLGALAVAALVAPAAALGPRSGRGSFATAAAIAVGDSAARAVSAIRARRGCGAAAARSRRPGPGSDGPREDAHGPSCMVQTNQVQLVRTNAAGGTRQE